MAVDFAWRPVLLASQPELDDDSLAEEIPSPAAGDILETPLENARWECILPANRSTDVFQSFSPTTLSRMIWNRDRD
jgi:hypothetical protein